MISNPNKLSRFATTPSFSEHPQPHAAIRDVVLNRDFIGLGEYVVPQRTVREALEGEPLQPREVDFRVD